MLQDNFDLLGRDLNAQYRFQTAQTQFDLFCLRQFTLYLNHFTGCATANLQHQFGSTLNGISLQAVIHTTLKTERRIRTKTVLTGFTGNNLRSKPSRFQYNILRLIRNRTCFAAHQTGQAQHTFFISDHQCIVSQSNRLLVQARQSLTILSTADNQTARQLIGIENMHRLTNFQHDIVADVH